MWVSFLAFIHPHMEIFSYTFIVNSNKLLYYIDFISIVFHRIIVYEFLSLYSLCIALGLNCQTIIFFIDDVKN